MRHSSEPLPALLNFTFLPGTTAQAQQAFIDAGARWSALYSDNIRWT